MIRFKPMYIVGGFTIQPASASGGKAGKGFNKTSTVQVVQNNMVLKSFVYKNTLESLKLAIGKAVKFIDVKTGKL